MNKETDTPRTDELEKTSMFANRAKDPICGEAIHHARQLERELSEVTKQRDSIEKKLCETCEPLHKYIEKHGNGLQSGFMVADVVIAISDEYKKQRDALLDLSTCKNPLSQSDNPLPIQSVLRILASQEGCDGSPWDEMIKAADRIDELENQVRISSKK